MNNIPQVYLKIFGKVQGVFFRAHTQKAAQKLGLRGWVRNTEDDCVEITAQGEKSALEEFIEWCRKGPDSANVEDIKTAWQNQTVEFQDFSILY